MRQGTYFKNAAILTVTGLALRVAGMFFRVYIAAKLGAGGMGLYQLIYTVYALAITIATAGVSVVATRIIAGLMARGKENEIRNAGTRLLVMGGILGGIAAVGLFTMARPAAIYWVQDERAALPLQILAPSLPFMALSAALRGVFMAQRRVGPNARAQIFEQIVRIALVVGILTVMQETNIEMCCAAVVLGNTVSEALSWVYMQSCYHKSVRSMAADKTALASPRRLMGLLVPIAASQYGTSVLRTFENVLVPNCLALFLLNRELAVEQFGALKGMAMPLLFFPFSFISTLATLLVPEITEAFVKKNTATLQYLVQRVIAITLLISVLAATIYTMLAYELTSVIYKDVSVGFYIRILGPITPFMYLESMVDGILKGMDQQVATFRYVMTDSVLRIIMIWFLLPYFGMQGFLFIMLFSNLFTSLLNLRRLLIVTQMKVQWKPWIIQPLFASGCSVVFAKFVLLPLLPATFPEWAVLVVVGLGASILYGVVLQLMGSLDFVWEIVQKKNVKKI